MSMWTKIFLFECDLWTKSWIKCDWWTILFCLMNFQQLFWKCTYFSWTVVVHSRFWFENIKVIKPTTDGSWTNKIRHYINLSWTDYHSFTSSSVFGAREIRLWQDFYSCLLNISQFCWPVSGMIAVFSYSLSTLQPV